MPATYVICPAGLVTGGPELLHQLVAALHEHGRQAHIVYFPFDRVADTPAAYTKYNVPVAFRADIGADDIVVLPEVYTSKAGDFARSRVFLWWLSVDNFRLGLGSVRVARVVPSRLRPLARKLAGRMRLLRAIARWAGRRGGIDILSGVNLHLYQSEFARQYLAANGLGPTAPLGDYINDDYLNLIANPSAIARENLVTFNPLKGAERTAAVVAALEERAVYAIPTPIQGYTRDGVRDLLSRAKLYIDFGNHPGKDRIPREAAAMGACVIVNRRGSAANDIDVPLPDAFKVDDEVDGFATDAAEKIAAILADFDGHARQLSAYRTRIAGEHEEFVRQALTIFP